MPVFCPKHFISKESPPRILDYTHMANNMRKLRDQGEEDTEGNRCMPGFCLLSLEHFFQNRGRLLMRKCKLCPPTSLCNATFICIICSLVNAELTGSKKPLPNCLQ